MALSAGTRLGPYEIVSFVAAGGMGEVYRARDTRLDRSVAIKVLPASFANDPDRLRRFEQEARAVAALKNFGPTLVSKYRSAAAIALSRSRSLPRTRETRWSTLPLSPPKWFNN